MNKNKNNSIIFLTTLSVYLGLVLVGGGLSPIMTQAATARSFDIQDEIEFKDDLDKKPKDNELKENLDAIEKYYDDLTEFIADLQKLHGIEKFDLDFDTFFLTEKSFVPCNPKGHLVPGRAEAFQRIDNHWIEPAIKDTSYDARSWDFLSDCLPDNKFDTAKSAGINLSYDKAEFKYEIFIVKDSPQKAEQLAENFAQAFKLYKPDEKAIIAGKLYEKTFFKAENNQVFIVTRLPRGSLDALLKQDAKAEK